MTIAIILLVLVAAIYICRREIKRAAKRNIRKAEDKLAALIVSGVKLLVRSAWMLARYLAREIVKLA
jgi:hypothetical protein